MNLKLGSLYVLPLFALQIAGSGCNRANPQAAGPQLPPPPLVSVVRAEAQDVPVYLDEIGKSFASESVTVPPQVGGRIMQREFQDGADLAKGQLLFVIDARPYQAQLDSAKGALAQAKAALALAKVEFARTSELLASKVTSKQDYDSKKSTVEVDQAQMESAEAALETAQLNLEYCYIHSPNQATQISQKGPFVYVVKPDNTADLRLVTLGQRQGENVVITQGVAAGESVIVAGQMTVAPNGKVHVDTAGAGPAAGAPASAK